MPLWLLLSLVAGGVAGIAFLTYALGFSRVFEFESDAVARMQWLRQWPDDDVRRVVRASHGRAALVEAGQGAGIVWSFGADTAARRISGASVTPCRKGLRLDLHDFTAPHIVLELYPDEARLWQEEIERMNS